jgi:exopolysaccharide production protein ExoZ
MNKLISIQALRGLAVLGVVAYHALVIEKKYSGGDLLLPDFFTIGQSGVDLFFVISGFVMVTVTKGRFARRGEMVRFLWGRFTRIYPTYWFYFFLTIAIFLIKPNWVNSTQGNQFQFLSSLLLLPSNQLPLVMVAWSLIYELWFYMVFAVLLRFHERLLLPSLLLWGAIITIVNLVFTVTGFSAGARIVFHPYSLEFIIGALVAVYISRERASRISARIAILIITFILSIGLPAIYVFNLVQPERTLRMSVIIGMLYGSLLFSVVMLEKFNTFALPKFLQFIGDISYTVYLSHILVLSAIGRLWLAATPAPNSLSDNMLACFMMLAAVAGYGWIGYRLVEQPILQVSHRLRTRWFENDRRNTPNPSDQVLKLKAPQ